MTDLNPGRFGRVVVLMGGWSAERTVSLSGGAAVLAALREAGVDAVGLDVGRESLRELEQGGFDRAFVMLHGRGGEDGVVQGALEWLQIPYTGSGVLGSALAMDKLCCKSLWRGMGLPTPDFVVLRPDTTVETVAELGFPLMVKPAREGSSIGMSKVEGPEAFVAARDLALAVDGRSFAEAFLPGAEYTCAVLNGGALPVIRVETPRSFYDYAAKYTADSTQYHIPCGLDAPTEQAMQDLSLQAFDAVSAQGWGRVDVMLDAAGAAWLIEVNTVPGMTDHSLVPMAAQAAGMDFSALVMAILVGSEGGHAG